jgi:hypothetical protein
MTTNSTTVEDPLAKVGIHLPDAPSPFDAHMDFKSLISTNVDGVRTFLAEINHDL